MLAKLVLLCFIARVHSDSLQALPEDYSGQRNCFLTHVPPQKPNSLLFCSKFNDLACCPPAQDDENLNMFQLLHDNGLSCRLRGDLRSDPMAILYCLNCDPKQPTYVRNLGYYSLLTEAGYAGSFPLFGFPTTRGGSSAVNSACVTSDGFSDFGRNASNLQSCFRTRTQQVLLCRDFMVNNFKLYPNIMSLWDQCLIQKNAPCLDSQGLIIPNRDRYTCGNDLVNPGTFYTDDDAVCGLVGFENSSNIKCRLLLMERAINQDSLGTPQIDENFGFRIVDGSCSADVFSTWLANYTDIMSGAAPFNPWILNGPACLMSADQVIEMNQNVNGINMTGSEYVYDEQCFNSAAGLGPSAVLLLALAALMSVFLM